MDEPSFVLPARPVFCGFRRPQCYNTDIAKKLSFRDICDASQSKSKDFLKVHLRIKPHTRQEHTTGRFEIEDENTLLIRIPESHTKGKKVLDCRYTFTSIFPENAQQEEIYNSTLSPTLRNFFLGSNYLLFSYGTTSSGKTYTLIGTASSPGLIPRALLSIFKSIDGFEDHNGTLCPNRGSSVTKLTQGELKANDELKKKIFEIHKEKYGSCTSLKSLKSNPSIQLSSDSLDEESYDEIKSSLLNDVEAVPLPPEEGVVYSVWISFAEIYNENIYDLLEPYEAGRPRKVLKLAHDKDRSTYIKDLHHVCVSSSEEAFKVLMFGKKNMSVSSTSLNRNSSRSHSIFSIKLLKKPFDNDETYYQVSSLTICDLAGSERQKKALTVGSRLKESSNINTSLLVLNRCFNIIRDNQLRADKQLVPFRDSKLTQLFQKALIGKEIMTMIVNINQSEELFEETQHILKSTAVALDIRVKKEPRTYQERKQSRFSVLCSKYSNASSVPWMSDSTAQSSVFNPSKESILENPNTACHSDAPSVPELLALVESLQEDLKKSQKELKEEVKKGKLHELTVRAEVSSQYKKLIAEMEEQYKSRIDQLGRRHKGITKCMEESYQRICKKRKASESDDEDDSPNDRAILLKKIEILKLDLDSAKESYSKANEEAKRLQKANITLHIKLSALESERTAMYQLSKDEDVQGVIDFLNKENCEKEKEIKSLGELLEEAREEFRFLTDTVKALENELSEKDEELSSKYESIEKFEVKEKALNDFIENQRKEIAKLRKEKGACDVDDDLASQFLKLSIEHEETTSALEKLKQEKEDVESKLDQLAAKYDQIVLTTQEMDELKNTNNGLKSFQEALIETHNAELQRLKNEMEALQKDFNKHLKEMESMNKELMKKDSEIDELKKMRESVSLEKVEAVNNFKALREEQETLKMELTKEIEEKKKALLEFERLQKMWDSKKLELEKIIEEKNKTVEELQKIQDERSAKQEELKDKALEEKQKTDLLMLSMKVTGDSKRTDLTKTEPRLRGRPRRTKAKSPALNSGDDDADEACGYRSYECGETDEDIFLDPKKKAATTVKKKKKTTHKKTQGELLKVPSYTYASKDGDEVSDCERSPVTRSQSSRRKLFTQSEDTMGDDVGAIELHEDQAQPSPCTIMKRALRKGK